MHLEDSTIEETSATPALSGRPRRKGSLTVILAVVMILLAIGIIPRVIRSSEAKDIAKAAETSVPVVVTVNAQMAPPAADLVLPGNIEAVYVATLYARTSGYVKRRLVDIGDRVKAGQLLADIESPEIDQELAQAAAALGQSKAAYAQAKANLMQSKAAVAQARANLDQAKANQEIAATTDSRWTRLVNKGVLSRQDGDERRATYNARQAEVAAAQANIQTTEATVTAQEANVSAAEANISAAQANVRRLEQMVSFEHVTAPFDGVITERKVERGDLVTAGSGSAQSSLFGIAQSGILRIQVQVPQAYAVDIHNGQEAQIDVRERAGTLVTGKVVRSANALNSGSRTLLTEIQVDNSNGALLPGMYAEVKFTLPRGRSVVLVPADTLVVNGEGTRVITIGPDHKARFQKIQVGRDLGPQIEVLNGLTGNERIVSNPSDSLTEGQPVRLRSAAASSEKS
jgi:RND family efflux transporter MFP subunit